MFINIYNFNLCVYRFDVMHHRNASLWKRKIVDFRYQPPPITFLSLDSTPQSEILLQRR